MPCAQMQAGGLVTVSHNKIGDQVTDLTGKAFTPTHMRDDPLIFSGYVVKRPKAKLAKYKATL